jgi:hypothetical protein
MPSRNMGKSKFLNHMKKSSLTKLLKRGEKSYSMLLNEHKAVQSYAYCADVVVVEKQNNTYI